MRKAQVIDGVVVNVIEVDPDNVPDWCADWPDAEDAAGPGDTFDGEAFSPSAEIVPRDHMALSFAQLLIGLVKEGWITEAEGDAWLTGTLPAPVVFLIATLPLEEQFTARAKALRPSVVLRQDPLVVALGTAQGKTDAELDTFFNTYVGV